MRQWWQNELFWRDIGPFLFPDAAWKTAKDDLDEVVELLEVEPSERILDLGCGPGRFLLPLVERGFEVVGVEHCATFRRMARQRAAELGHAVDIRPVDMLGAIESHMRSAREQGIAPSPAGLMEELELGIFDAVLDIFALIGYHESPVVDAILLQWLF